MGKTKNNLENKAAFMAQYWGQNAMRCITPHGLSPNVKPDPLAFNNDRYFLELTPLSQISDEDKEYLLNETNFNGSSLLTPIAIDYLRSKGYAVPFRNLSVQDLIDYGWIRLNK